METAEVEIGLSSAVIMEKVNGFVKDVEASSSTTVGQITSLSVISLQNQSLIAYLFSILKNHPLIYAHYIGTKEGSFFEVLDMRMSGRKTFISDPKKYLPQDAFMALRFIDRSKTPAEENWYYKNLNLEPVAEEQIKEVKYDPRLRPWYVGTAKSNKLFWTDMYKYESLKGSGVQSLGISAGVPMMSPSGELLGVVGADVTLGILSQFISEQSIAKTGKAFILDKTGAILAPFAGALALYPKWFSNEIVSMPFKAYSLQAKTKLDFKDNKTKFLSAIHEFPVSEGSKWLILIIAPLEEFLASLLTTQKEVLIISVIILVLSVLIVYFASNRTARPITVLAEEINKIKHFQVDSQVRVNTSIREIFLLDESIAAMRSAIGSFARYVPKEIVRILIEKGIGVSLGGIRKEVTILFTDIVGFTAIVEKLPTEAFTSMLAEYFDNLSKTILTYEGTIDKYIGDSIMAFWGAPADVDNPNIKACTCVLVCQDFIRTFNERQIQKGNPPMLTRFGMDFGPVIVGNIGTLQRMNYTALGDAVNVASRLEELSKLYGTSILISENVVSRLDHQFHVRPLDYLAVKGRIDQIKVYELLGKMTGNPQILTTPENIQLSEEFTAAYNAFSNKEFGAAKTLLEKLQSKFPNDLPTKIYLERVQKLV